MKKIALAIAAAGIIGFAGSASANCAATNALIAADPEAFEFSDSADTDRMAHKNAPLRFQCGGGFTGIAIPGGSEANFDNARLRASGDPTFGSVVEMPEPD